YYWKIFVGVSRRFRRKYDPNRKGWPIAWNKAKNPYPIQYDDVLDHLKGKNWVSVEQRDFSPLFCIDIDFKAKNFKKRYLDMVEILPNPLVVRSSESRGLHLYYFITNKASKRSIHESVKFLMASNGLMEKPGKYEIFPGVTTFLRLPFGEGSFLVDPITLESLNLDLYETIGRVMDHPRIELPPRAPKTKIIIHRKKSSEGTSDRIYRAKGLLENGITELGTRNISLLLLVQYFMLDLKYTSSETESLILDWLDSFQHESEDWLNNPKSVTSQVTSMVKRFDEIKYSSTHFKRDPLSLQDVQNIISYFEDQQPWGAEVYRQQHFIFDLLSWYASQDQAEVDLAFNFVRRFEGGSQKTAKRRMEFCESNGILIKTRRHDWLNRKSRRYKVNFEYEDGTQVRSLTEGIHLLYSKTEIYRLYSRAIARRITTDVNPGQKDQNNYKENI
nr:hypothetical protein [FCB group bacterium]